MSAMRNALAAAVAAFALMLMAASAAAHSAVDVCVADGSSDPCMPGGKWDPILGRCEGYADMACFGGYSGPLCKTRDSNATLVSQGGEPVVFQEYWEALKGKQPCAAVSAAYRDAYQRFPDAILFEPLNQTIRQLHALVGNAETDGYTIVPGYGSTGVLKSVLYAHAMRTQRRGRPRLSMLVQAPWYPAYQSATQNAFIVDGETRGFRWNPDADPAADTTVEINCWPNNPDGAFRTPRVKEPSRVVHDCVYLWPQFTSNITEKLRGDVMLFSASKLSGMAGSRFGWALVKDPAFAALMVQYLMSHSIGVSIDGQLRIYDALSHMVGMLKNDDAAVSVAHGQQQQQQQQQPEFFDFSARLMRARFARLREIFASTPNLGFTFHNGEVRGAYAWVSCPATYAGSCAALFESAVRLKVNTGVMYGTSGRFVRLTLMMRSVEIEQVFERVERLLRLRQLPVVGSVEDAWGLRDSDAGELQRRLC